MTRLADRLLPAWFLAWSALRLYQLGFIQLGWNFDWLGRDFRIYRNAALAIVNGTDPWSAFDRWNGTDWHFAALPTAAQLFVPFAWIPEGIGLAIFLGMTIVVALAALRRLGLPWWWLLFPPIMEGLAAANPQILILGLLLVGGPVARAIASGLKIYGLVPVIARREWIAVLATAILIGASIALGPSLWSTYLGEFGAISARLGQESQADAHSPMIGVGSQEAQVEVALLAWVGLLETTEDLAHQVRPRPEEIVEQWVELGRMRLPEFLAIWRNPHCGRLVSGSRPDPPMVDSPDHVEPPEREKL